MFKSGDELELSNEEIERRLVFAARLRGYNPERGLSPWLEQEESALRAEQLRRVTGILGDGI